MTKLITQYRGLKKEIYILFVGKLVTAMGSFVWPMLTFFLTTKLGLSDGTATVLIATATVLSLPAALLGGKLADRFSRKYIIIIFDCLTVALYIIAAILPTSYITAVLIFLAGLFQTIESPAYDALNADFSTSEQREKAYSLSYLGFNLGFIIGAAVSGLLFQKYIWLAFLLNALAVFTSTVLIWIFIHMKNAVGADEDTASEVYNEYEMPMDEKTPVMRILRERRVVLFGLLLGCFAWLPSNVAGILLPLQLKEAMGEYGATVYGYLSSLNGATVIVCTPVFSMLLRKMTELPKAALGLLLFCGGLSLYSVGTALATLFLGMFVFSVGEVISVLGANPYASRRIPASHRGRIGGITSVMSTVFSAMTQYLIGGVLMLTQSNYRLIWIVIISCGVLAAVLYALLYRADKKAFPLLYEKRAEDGAE